MKLRSRNRCFNNYLAEIAYKEIDRVKQKEVFYCLAIAIDIIKNSGHIHQKQRKNAPQVLDVSEKNKERRQNKADSDVKEDKPEDRIDQEDELPGECDMIKNAKNKEHAERQAKVNKALDIFGHQEKILRYIHFGKDTGVLQQAAHPLAR